MIRLDFNGVKINVYSIVELEDADADYSGERWYPILEGEFYWHCLLSKGEVMQANGWLPNEYDNPPQAWFDEQLDESRRKKANQALKLNEFTSAFFEAKEIMWAERGYPNMSRYQIVYNVVQGDPPDAFWSYREGHRSPIWMKMEFCKLQQKIVKGAAMALAELMTASSGSKQQ